MLNKFIERKILIDTLFIEYQLDISSIKNSLIQDIELGITDKKNLNHITNVKGNMTQFKYFNNNNNFNNVLSEFFQKIDVSIQTKPLVLFDAWGIKIDKGQYTELHDHKECVYSGILYLNDANFSTNFPDLNIKIIPKEGSFLLFSGFLTHNTEINNSNISKYAIPFNFVEKKHWFS